MRKCILVLFISILSVFCCLSCVNRNIYLYFNTDCILDLSGTNSNRVKQSINLMLEQIDNTLSTSINESDVSRINSASANEIIHVNDSTIALLSLSKELYTLNNNFNPAIYPIVELWNFSPENFTGIAENIPDESDIINLLELCNFNNIVWDSDNNTVYKTEDNAKIDFGAIAKGYACDLSFEEAKSLNSAVINIGGTIKTINEITVHIKNPRPINNQFAATIIVPANNAISTSGDYERFYYFNEVRYHHIFDSSGYPAGSKTLDPILSVSIVGPSATMCDALSTLVFINGLHNSMQEILSSYGYTALLFYYNHYESYGNISINILEDRYL